MDFIKKHKYTFLCACFGILISPLMYFVYNKTTKLTPFEITSFEQNVKNEESFRTLTWTKSYFAKKYQVVVLNEENKIIDIMETKDTKIKLDKVTADNGENIVVNVNAVD